MNTLLTKDGPSPYTAKKSTDEESKESGSDVSQKTYETFKAKVDEESDEKSVDWATDKDRVKPPFIVRMINDDRMDPLYKFDTHIKLNEMNKTRFIQSSEIRIIPKKSDKSSLLNYVCLALSTVGCIIIIAIEFVYICIGINHFRNCGLVDIYLITSGVFHILIVILEWIRGWIGNVKHHKESLPCIHIFQLTSGIFLSIIYLFCVIWFTIGFAWIMVPYTESLNRPGKDEEIKVIYMSTVIVFTQTYCTVTFYHGAILYQTYVLCVFIFRLVVLCFGQTCRSFFMKVTASYTTNNSLTIPFVGENQLSNRLPPISTFRIFGNGQPPISSRTIHGRSTCMIMTYPEWRDKQ